MTVLALYLWFFLTKKGYFFFFPGERNPEEEPLLPLLHRKRSEKNSKTLKFNGNGKDPFQFVSGVQSRLRKERLIFQRQRRPWICWCVLLRGNSVHED